MVTERPMDCEYVASEGENSNSSSSRIYFLARNVRRNDIFTKDDGDSFWYVVDLGSGSNETELKARKLEKQIPARFYRVEFGLCGSLIYGLGGFYFYPNEDASYSSEPEQDQTVYLYNTSTPEHGWFKGPPLIMPRWNPDHQAINGDKLYVLGGLESPPGCHHPWAEYLDLSSSSPRWRGLCLEYPDIFAAARLPPLDREFDPERHILCRSVGKGVGQFLLC